MPLQSGHGLVCCFGLLINLILFRAALLDNSLGDKNIAYLSFCTLQLLLQHGPTAQMLSVERLQMGKGGDQRFEVSKSFNLSGVHVFLIFGRAFRASTEILWMAFATAVLFSGVPLQLK